MQPLRFPRFYKSVMSQQHWDANDFKGRVKVEISEGYVKLENDKQVFVKLMIHATFNFQPAPLGKLSFCCPLVYLTFSRCAPARCHRLAKPCDLQEPHQG